MIRNLRDILRKFRPSDNKSNDYSSRIRLLQEYSISIREREAIADFVPADAIGVELGVAFAGFSTRLLQRNKSLFLYGVDMYAGDRGHDIDQYKLALSALMAFKDRSLLIRARFDEIVGLFPDNYFDFVYVDGYAHTGEEGGATFRQWFPKLKPFGIIAGDDYHSDWPLVMKEVDAFLAENDLPLFEISNSGNAGTEWSQWFTIKGPSSDARYFNAVERILKSISH
jgi:hypothetical protein